MMAFMPEPHILLMVVAGTPCGMPAPSAAWRAGAWPRPAGSTQPMMTSCTSAAAISGGGERALDGGGAELRRGGRREHALECADGRAHGGGDDDLDLVHVMSRLRELRSVNRGRAGRG